MRPHLDPGLNVSGDPTTARLVLLRAAVAALPGLRADALDVERLLALLRVLDPSLGGEACGAAGWVSSTGMPSPQWIMRAHALRATLIERSEGDDLPDEGLVRATAMDPELGQRLLAQRTFRRFLRRHALFPAAAPTQVAHPDGPWVAQDAVWADGRWIRTQVAGTEALSAEDCQELDVDALALRVKRAVRRTIVGPCWGHLEGPVRGLYAEVQASGEAPVRRLAIDRMVAEDIDEPGLIVVPFAVPDPS